MRILIFEKGMAVSEARLPCRDNLLNGLREADRDVPGGIVVTHFAQVAVVANVIADAIFIHVGVGLFFSGVGFGN